MKNKLRGRINKYQRQIENEDQEETDLLGQHSVLGDSENHEDSLAAIIKEQEEEEEELRMKVAEERIKMEAAKVERRAKLAEAEKK